MTRTSVDPEMIAGRYRVVSKISSGGMGEVFRAKDTVLGRTVAVKVMPPSLAANSKFVDKFLSEAQAAARISHPNVVQVHDWGEWDTTFYMVMEHIRGRNLRDVLVAKKKLVPRHACDLMAQVMAGLHAAHTEGLVHRDVKPENILISHDGSVKVADFGIARAAESEATGGLFGTVSYVAPEQIRNQLVGGTADIYSSGCVLYELLTGVPPFEGDAASVLDRHLNARVGSPSLEEPAVSDSIDQIVLRATEPLPERRFASAEKMSSELSGAASAIEDAGPLRELVADVTGEIATSNEATLARGASSKRRWLPWLAAVLLFGALAIVGYAFRPIGVPDVIGESETNALKVLADAGFEAQIERISADELVGTVLGTSPAAGDLQFFDRNVTLRVSLGPPIVNLPELIGMSEQEAVDRLDALGLVSGINYEYASQPVGTVIAQDPQPGKLREGTPVNLTVSKGPEMVAVPSLVGKLYAEAQESLKTLGLTANKQEVFDDAAEGTVLAQSPKPDSEVAKGSAVTLTVSKGPEPFAMPNVKSKTCTIARRDLQALGLVVVIRSSGGGASCGANRVLEQDPLPETTVRKGDEVKLYVS